MLGEPASRTQAAVFFDFDGTLLDTETIVLASWEREYEHHGHVLDRQAWLDMVGTEGRDRYADLAVLVSQGFDLGAEGGCSPASGGCRRHLPRPDTGPSGASRGCAGSDVPSGGGTLLAWRLRASRSCARAAPAWLRA